MNQMQTSKSVLAKLLSSENLTIEHGNYKTAAFDVKNRVLYLPVFKYMNGDVYDLMVLHEVGHALFTPEDGYHSASHDLGQGFKSYLNVCEDVRIEKKIKRKYPGGIRSMIQGYRKLMSEDFFGTANINVNRLNLIDRINLHTKGGASQGISFNEIEMEFVKRAEEAETFEEIEQLAKDIYAYSKENESQTDVHDNSMINYSDFDDEFEDSEEIMNDWSDDEGSDEGSDEGYVEDSDEGSVEDSDDQRNNEKTKESNLDEENEEVNSNGQDLKGGPSGNNNNEPCSYTDEQWQNNAHRLNEDNTKPYIYVNIPKALLHNIVVDYKILYNNIDDFYTKCDSNRSNYYFYRNVKGSIKDKIYQQAKYNVSEFRKKNNKTVDYLVKEFEMRKRADEYKRTNISKTGLLDMSNIHSFKYNDNLFKRVATITTGKNHGLVMFIDWSGSMSHNLDGTIDQLLNLVMFCRKVNIPFEVYSFSDNVLKSNFIDKSFDRRSLYDENAEGLFSSNEKDLNFNYSFSLLQLFSNKMSTAELNKAFEFMMIMKSNLSRNYYNHDDVLIPSIPEFMSLGGTPLNAAIVASLELIPKFQKENRVQIVNSVFLTDGESHMRECYWTKDKKVTTYNCYRENVFYVDPITKRKYPISNRTDHTQIFFNALRDRLNVNVMGFYIINSRLFKGYSKTILSDKNFEDILKDFRNKNCFVAKNHKGYDELYYIKDGKNLNVDSDEFTIKEDATKSQIVSAFKKFNRDKIASRIVMKCFAEMIA